MNKNELMGVSIKNVLRPLNCGGVNHKNVAKHTYEVLEHLATKKASDVLMLAGLCHDLGKPSTMKETNGKVTYLHHEKEGAKYVAKVFKKYGIDKSYLNYVQTMVSLHMRPFSLIGEQITDDAFVKFAKVASSCTFDLFVLASCDCTPANFHKNCALFNKVRKRMVDVLAKSGKTPNEIMKIYGAKYSDVKHLYFA